MPITKKKKKIIKLSASQKQKEKLKKKIRDREVAAIRGKALGTDKLGPLFRRSRLSWFSFCFA